MRAAPRGAVPGHAGRAAAVALAALLLASGRSLARQEAPQADPNDGAIRSGGEERIQVLEEPWKVGDVKTYSLVFDYAPLGRQTIRLDRVSEEEGDKVLEFSQMLHLDLRALGQEGQLYNFGSVRYAQGKLFRRYSFSEVLKSWAGYSTYEPRGKMREREVTLAREGDHASLAVKVDASRDEPEARPVLDHLGSSVLVDLEIVGHWERLFLFDTWTLGEEKTIPMVVPSEPVVYDFHIPVKDFRPINPTLKDVTLKVEALEDVSVFSIPIQAFRCSFPQLGYTIWVTARGGVIRFDNGKGLTGMLER